MSDTPETSIESELRAFIEAQLGHPLDLPDDAPLMTSGYIPSMQFLALTGFIEDRFGVDGMALAMAGATSEDIESIEAIGGLVRRARGDT